MPYTNKPIILSSVVIFAFALTSSTTRGDLVTSLEVNVTENTNGSYQYDYTIDNLAASTLPAVEFTLSVDPSANLQAPFGPSDWIITYNLGDQVIDWASPSSADGVLAGNSAAFGFISSLPPVVQSYSVLGINDATGDVGFNTGTILSPEVNSVPEPSGFKLMILGGIASSISIWTKRWFLRRRSKYRLRLNTSCRMAVT